MLEKYLPLVARSFLAVIFLYSGINKVFNFAATNALMNKVGLPIAEVLLVLTIAVEILGGLSVISGYKAKIGALILTIFLVPTTLIFHNFLSNPTQIISFLKNLAIMGGLLMVVAYLEPRHG